MESVLTFRLGGTLGKAALQEVFVICYGSGPCEKKKKKKKKKAFIRVGHASRQGAFHHTLHTLAPCSNAQGRIPAALALNGAADKADEAPRRITPDEFNRPLHCNARARSLIGYQRQATRRRSGPSA